MYVCVCVIWRVDYIYRYTISDNCYDDTLSLFSLSLYAVDKTQTAAAAALLTNPRVSHVRLPATAETVHKTFAILLLYFL